MDISQTTDRGSPRRTGPNQKPVYTQLTHTHTHKHTTENIPALFPLHSSELQFGANAAVVWRFLLHCVHYIMNHYRQPTDAWGGRVPQFENH